MAVETSVVSQLPISGQFEMLTSAFFHVDDNSEPGLRSLYLSRRPCGSTDAPSKKLCVCVCVCVWKGDTGMSQKLLHYLSFGEWFVIT